MLTSAFVKDRARARHFDLCGIARADRPARLARLADWIARGYAGDMAYLAASLDERADPAAVLPTVRSIISLGVIYNTRQPYSIDISDGARSSGRRSSVSDDGRQRRTASARSGRRSSVAIVSRYAWGDDYHDILRARLRRLLGDLTEAAEEGFEAFSCVDSGPVQERVFAEQAGLGWIGKNTCLINPALGSWIFLAEVLTNADIDADTPALDHCGTCTRCLEACPTGAIVEPYMVDATRCLSYLTIEARGGVEMPLRSALAGRVYGCDICQEVCPWNRRGPFSDDPAWQPRSGLLFPSLLDLCRLSDDDWRSRLKGSAMRRAGLRRIRRTLAYAAAEIGVEASEALDALASHPSAADPFVAEAIAWARSRLGVRQ